MVGGKVEHGEHMLVVIYLGTLIKCEAHAREYVDNLVCNNGNGMTCAQTDGVGGACQVDVVTVAFGILSLFLELIDSLYGGLLQFVDFHSDGFLLVGRHIAEVCHEGVDLTFLAKIFQAKLLYLFGVGCCQRTHLLK